MQLDRRLTRRLVTANFTAVVGIVFAIGSVGGLSIARLLYGHTPFPNLVVGIATGLIVMLVVAVVFRRPLLHFITWPERHYARQNQS